MAVLKNKTQGNYTIVSQNIMRDKNLSLTERGMLTTLLSLPDNWHLTIMGLCQILPDGKDKISKTLNSLIDKGYVTREQARSGRGKFDSTILEVHETPVNSTESADHNEGEPGGDDVKEEYSPCPENPDTVNTDTDKPHAENPPQYNNNISNNQTVTIHRVRKTDTLTDTEYDDLVSEFGKTSVDYQIERITNRGYKGCLNFDTIKTWCRERLNRAPSAQSPPTNRNRGFNYMQRTDYDFDELERILVCNG